MPIESVAPGGTLITCSCSYNVSEAMFGEIHPALTTTLHNLAVVCEGNGGAEEARELWARAMTLLSHDDAVAEA